MLPTIMIALGHVTSLHNIAVPTLIITASRMIRSSRHLYSTSPPFAATRT